MNYRCTIFLKNKLLPIIHVLQLDRKSISFLRFLSIGHYTFDVPHNLSFDRDVDY